MVEPRDQAEVNKSDGISRTDYVVLQLREMLLRGDFDPGERLTEMTLAARLGASRTPVRLALDRLAHEGLLKALPAVGFVVCEFTLADIWDAIEIRGVLEGTAARFAAERLESPTELDTLKGYCDAMDAVCPTDLQKFVTYLEVNEAFHEELRNLAKSPMLARAIESIAKLPFAAPGALVFGEAEPAHSQQASEIAQEHHRGIVEAIGNREGARAESLAREHSRVARKNLTRALQDRDLFKRVPGGSLIKFPKAV